MQVTAILKNLSEAFYNGHGTSIESFLAKSAREQFDYCNGSQGRDLGITLKFGRGSFGERVDFNRDWKTGKPMTSKIEPRKGYKLVTFTMFISSVRNMVVPTAKVEGISLR